MHSRCQFSEILAQGEYETIYYGLPAPRFEIRGIGFMVTIFAPVMEQGQSGNADRVTDRVTDTLSDNRQRILALLKANPRMSLAELAKELGISRRKVIENTNKLKDSHLLQREGNNKTGHWVVK